MVELFTATPRVEGLRKAYLSESLMSVGIGRVRGTGYNMMGTRMLRFTEGWMQNCGGSTRLRYCKSEAYMLSHMNPVLTDGELIVGQPELDWEAVYTPEEAARLREIYYRDIQPGAFAREGHLAFDYERLLCQGVRGMLEEINTRCNALDLKDGRNFAAYEFYLCAGAELEALLVLEEKYAQAVDARAQAATGEKRRELEELRDVIRRVPKEPAQTFREALQSIHFYTFNLQGLFSFGRPDDYLLPYYRRDIANGTLTVQKAQELIDCFCMLFAATVPPWTAAGFMLGGRDRNGKAVENELTWLFLNSISHTHLPDPGIGFCVTNETSDEIIRFVATLLAKGESHPAIWNDRIVTENLVSYGVAQADAYQYTHSTCVEITPIGCANWQITSPYVNMLQAFLDAFEEFTAQDDLDAMLDRFTVKLGELFDREMVPVNLGLLEQQRNGMVDPARVSCLLRDCIGRGRFKENGGALYDRLACDFLGLCNVAECFHVIDRLVLKDRTVSLEALRTAVRRNFAEDGALLTQIRSGVRHYGNNDPESDALAKRIADIAVDCARARKDIYGHPIIPGAFSYDNHVQYGKLTKASPDGRLDYEPLHDGSNPVQGYDQSGPTATLQSVSAYAPSRFSGGIAVNLKLTPNDAALPAAIAGLIHSFLALDIPEMQFSVVNGKDLKAAQTCPEAYQDLLVRVGGFSDFFVKMEKITQDELIRRAENQI